jgi:uncharacterized ParB-like nuclease family protein
MTNEHGKSDRPIVPGKSPNKIKTPMAEEMEGRGLAKGNLGQQNAIRTQSRVVAPSELTQIRQTAKSNKDVKFTALMHHIYRDRHPAVCVLAVEEAGSSRCRWGDVAALRRGL